MATAVTVTGGKIDQLTTLGGETGKVVVDRIKEVQEISKVKNVYIKRLPCPKVNDKGLTGAWRVADKIAMAVTAWATLQAWKAAKEDYEIGKRYFDLAKEQWDHFYKVYRPLEDQELSEIWADDEKEPDYEKTIKGHTRLIEPIFAQADKHKMSTMAKYCICRDVSELTKFQMIKSTTYGDSANFARKYADKYTQELNDIRWDRRISAMARGRGVLNNSLTFASKASDFYRAYASAMAGFASSANEFRGYINNRNQTLYNGNRTEIDTRSYGSRWGTDYQGTLGWRMGTAVSGATVPSATGGQALGWADSYNGFHSANLGRLDGEMPPAEF